MRAVAFTAALAVLGGCAARRREVAITCVMAGAALTYGGFHLMKEDDDGGGIEVPFAMMLTGVGILIGGPVIAFGVAEPRRESLSPLDVAGALVLANSPKETADTLAQGAGIDRLIALRIVAHRDVDRFDTLAELRTVPGVDDAVLDRLIQRGRALGYAR